MADVNRTNSGPQEAIEYLRRYGHTREDAQMAADTIESLQAEVKSWKRHYEDRQQGLIEAEAEVERLRDLLQVAADSLTAKHLGMNPDTAAVLRQIQEVLDGRR